MAMNDPCPDCKSADCPMMVRPNLRSTAWCRGEQVCQLEALVAALTALFERRALLHKSDAGYFFELYGKPATAESFSTVKDAAFAALKVTRHGQ